MCTLIVISRYAKNEPLIVAANRDERLTRAATPPRIWTDRRILAPRDEVAHGTWLGVNAAGVFVGITNRHHVKMDPSRASRGDLVLRALDAPSAEAAYRSMATIDAAEQNGFHLVMADSDGAYLVWGDGESLHTSPLAPGIHVVTERSFGAAPTGREPLLAARIREVLRPDVVPNDDDLIGLLTLQPTGGGFDDVTVHVPDLGYGTRSSTIVRLKPNDITFAHADGPPTTAPFTDYSEIARTLVFEAK